ncbi:MAG: methionine synthase [Gammaproteobacteria bacterium]|nr:methionine synthase [Gammaproteobacteria bacterium]
MKEENSKGLSDDAFDAITAVVIIAVAVIGVVFWLSGMPT